MTTKTSINKILIVEDESLVALDIKEILDMEGYETFIAINAGQALNALKTEAFNLVLLDINLESAVSGVDLADYIQENYSSTPYIYLTSYSDRSTMKLVGHTSPAGFITKPFQKAQLISTIYLALCKYKGQPLQAYSDLKISSVYPFKPFSEREVEIIQHLVNGANNKQISEALFVSVNTIKFHIKNIYEKLGVHSRTELLLKLNQK